MPVLLLLCLVLSAFWLVPQARADLVINEILGDPNQDWDGDGSLSYKGDEWIEVRNTGGSNEDLSFFWLRDTFGEDMHLRLSGFLEPGAVAVFYGSDAMAWQQEQGMSLIGFSINNTGDSIELFRLMEDETTSAMVMIHRVTLSNHEVEDDRSSGWELADETWAMFDGLNHYNGSLLPLGTECLPTPGEVNECQYEVPVAETTWDHLKSQYR